MLTRFWFLKTHGVIAPVATTALHFRVDNIVDVVLPNGQTFQGPVTALEVVSGEDVAEILDAIKRGIPYK